MAEKKISASVSMYSAGPVTAEIGMPFPETRTSFGYTNAAAPVYGGIRVFTAPGTLIFVAVVLVEVLGQLLVAAGADADVVGAAAGGDDHIFVMGDNRPQSQDSRAFGPIDGELILGRAWLRYFPLERIGLIERPEYPALDTADAGGWILVALPAPMR